MEYQKLLLTLRKSFQILLGANSQNFLLKLLRPTAVGNQWQSNLPHIQLKDETCTPTFERAHPHSARLRADQIISPDSDIYPLNDAKAILLHMANDLVTFPACGKSLQLPLMIFVSVYRCGPFLILTLYWHSGWSQQLPLPAFVSLHVCLLTHSALYRKEEIILCALSKVGWLTQCLCLICHWPNTDYIIFLFILWVLHDRALPLTVPSLRPRIYLPFFNATSSGYLSIAPCTSVRQPSVNMCERRMKIMQEKQGSHFTFVVALIKASIPRI